MILRKLGYLDGVRLDLPQLSLLVQGCSRIPQLLVIENFLQSRQFYNLK
jgi:hypothetical protein